MKTATAEECRSAAIKAAHKDAEHGLCDPAGCWHNWRLVNNLWNSDGPEEQALALTEGPLARGVFTTAYLTTQGWKR